MPLPPPTALNVGRRGAPIELSEVCSSVGQLEARAGEGLALAPLTEACNLAMILLASWLPFPVENDGVQLLI